MASTHKPCVLGTPLALCQRMPRLSSYCHFAHSPSHSLFSLAFTHKPCVLGTPLALCQRMPRLSSYCHFVRAILNCIDSQTMRNRHASGPVPGGATTEQLPPIRARHSQWQSHTNHARPFCCYLSLGESLILGFNWVWRVLGSLSVVGSPGIKPGAALFAYDSKKRNQVTTSCRLAMYQRIKV
jgi:hypothetical protein